MKNDEAGNEVNQNDETIGSSSDLQDKSFTADSEFYAVKLQSKYMLIR